MADIKRKLEVVEGRLRADLAEAPAMLEHAGNKGTAVEKAFRQYLCEHLPRT